MHEKRVANAVALAIIKYILYRITNSTTVNYEKLKLKITQ